VAFTLTLVGAMLACGLEMLEALAIVLAVGITRRFRDSLIGAAGAAMALALLALVLGPVLISRVPLAPLRVLIGAFLLLFGLEWLRKGVLRLAHLRSPSSSFKEFVEEQEELESLGLPPPGQADWAGRTIAFKGVLLEGVEVVVIFTALAARPSGAGPAVLGAAVACVAVVGTGAWLRKPLARVPETELKWGVGVLLSAFGVFFLAEGLHVDWPGGDAAILYLVATLAAVSQLQSHALARA
jgi:Ca2+/H+ antiporter, TMEM165/GDT1 family